MEAEREDKPCRWTASGPVMRLGIGNGWRARKESGDDKVFFKKLKKNIRQKDSSH